MYNPLVVIWGTVISFDAWGEPMLWTWYASLITDDVFNLSSPCFFPKYIKSNIEIYHYCFQITQCTREARTGVNITLDSDNIRFYTNVTSCLLAKARCGSYNPITGDTQLPGYVSTGITRASNALQFSDSGELRILAFSANTPVTNSFCSTTSNLTQSSWLTNVC